ncbi:putative armadillo-like helical protein [Helianthus annuus]|nr:putative armadillo-like helical protein [Helianthus annuus]KAJ0460904.1 putative armadillo-like helical protein [Helianthus annuus]KAJ0641331.1 putative armadillo-like helical protein [Helianthus annuus]KAJ0645234.1 putative armadillo-like helical protein [Helianthus annuus]
MVSLQESSNPGRVNQITRPYYTPPYSSSSSTPSRFQKHLGRSMRTVRSNLHQSEYTNSCSFVANIDEEATPSENLTDSVIDVHLHQLATAPTNNISKSSFSTNSTEEYLGISQALSEFSACSSDISGELQRLACLPEEESSGNQTNLDQNQNQNQEQEFLQRENFSTEIIESISPEDLQPTVKICVDSLSSTSVVVKRSAAGKLRLLAKNRPENRALIGESGAIPALLPLLRCADPWTQENAVTALLNLSLLDENKPLIAGAGAVKSLIYVLKTGTEVSKQNAACALLNLAMIDENKVSIGACGAIPPLVSLLINGSNRGKKDALTTLYKLCSTKTNKKRAVTAGVVKPLVELVVAAGEAGEEQGAVGMAEKALVVLCCVAGVDEGKTAIVEEGGIQALVEVIEDGASVKAKEFSVVTLLQLCEGVNGGRNRGLLVGEGVIPPLVALSQTGTARAKHKAETLLGYLREPRQEGCSSSPK